MSDHLALHQGKSIISKKNVWYRIIQQLGAGGNAVTYLVVATSGENMGILFALKMFRRISKPERRESFLREVEFLQKNTHPAIMRVFDDGLFNYFHEDVKYEYPFVVAEYLPQTLYHVIRANRLRTAERVALAVQLLSALVFLEKSNPQIVHRDIKPQNIFVKGHSCVLGDFGLMKRLINISDNEETEDERDLFKASIGVGMPWSYRTPDLVAYAKQESDLTIKTDVFQLGLVLVELFTGINPSKKPEDILFPVELNPISFCPGIHGKRIYHILREMLEVEPSQRALASELMNQWINVFHDTCEDTYKLESTVF